MGAPCLSNCFLFGSGLAQAYGSRFRGTSSNLDGSAFSSAAGGPDLRLLKSPHFQGFVWGTAFPKGRHG